jgi:signal transduction histidine kinase
MAKTLASQAKNGGSIPLARFARWFDERPVAGDASLALLLLVAFVLPSDLSAETDAAVDLAFSVALLACLPFRRVAPVAVFVAVSVICLLQIALIDHAVAGDVVALIAVYTVVAYGPGTRIGVAATACTAVGALLGAVRWDVADEGVSLLATAATTVSSALFAATLGAWRRSRRSQLAALEQSNRLLALERDQQAAVGAALERARIARELHDVVAHSLSVIVVQADGAAAAAEERPAAAAALRTIGDTGREALGQMRRLLGVLRTEAPDDAALAPQPGTDQLEALVEQVVHAGLPAGLAVEGRPRALAPEVDVTVYRLAQEALTNVIKHAGRVERVDVVLRYGDEAVELLVRDDGGGAQHAGDGGGHGLVGMRERVDLHHGTLAAGPLDDGGFEVHAVLPAAA